MDVLRVALRFAFAAMLAACASTPPAAPEGEQELAVTAILRLPAIDLVTGQPMPATYTNEPVEGASCTLSNDRGTWTTFTPGKVRVQRSSGALAIECVKEGFRPVRWKVECLTPREQEKRTGGDVGFALSLLMIPAGIVTWPVGGGSFVVQGALGVGEHAYTASRPDVCSYRPIVVPMHKLDE